MLDIIIVSHNNQDDVCRILQELSDIEEVNIWVRDNLAQSSLREICETYNVNYSPALRVEGFALNNNIICEQVVASNELSNNKRYFLFMNPDAFIKRDTMLELLSEVAESNPDMFTIDLYKDDDYQVRDPSIRKFPTLMTFLSSFLFNRNRSIIERDTLTKNSKIDWCASSFFGVESSLFKKLNGFDSSYFMYCEDVDICFRANKAGHKLTYYPNIKGIHRANHGSKKIFSLNFYWHLNSAARYLWKKCHAAASN